MQGQRLQVELMRESGWTDEKVRKCNVKVKVRKCNVKVRKCKVRYGGPWQTETRIDDDGIFTKYLTEGLDCEVLTWNSKVIGVEVPMTVELEVGRGAIARESPMISST